MPRDDNLGDVDVCRACGHAIRHAYVEGLGPLDLDAEPRVGVGFDEPLAWTWRGRLGAFGTRVSGYTDPSEPTYVAHPCGVTTKRGAPRMSDPFGTSKPMGEGVGQKELEGRLLLLSVHSFERGKMTAYGPSDVAKGEAVDLGDGTMFEDVALWGIIAGRFEPGVQYVGRIGRGVAQPGKSAPWTWTDGSDEDKAIGVRYLAHVASTAPATAPPATAPPATASASEPPW